jgi:hypothetical protein
MRTHILDEARHRQLLAARSTAHLMPPFEHGGFEPCSRQVTGYNRSVMSATYNDCIILFIWHIDLLKSLSFLKFHYLLGIGAGPETVSGPAFAGAFAGPDFTPACP